MFETNETAERVILVAVDSNQGGGFTAESSLDELSALAETSGAEVVGTLIQRREKIHAAHYLGKGKLQELIDLISLTKANAIICDDELTATQQRNMEKALDVTIIDRTMLILDIFAKHATTKEGYVQVELAQHKYNLSHLTGIGTALSRLGGGIGTRGPGEKKLETDRRHIRNRIHELSEELKTMEAHRQVLREKRKKAGEIVVSMVGYTNAGKSTLMNALTNAGVYSANKLFATLDTTTRRIDLPSGGSAFITDTVGFIQKLPHNLIKAFKATLAELMFADILLHVVDAADPMYMEHIDVTLSTLKELGCEEKPVITVFNKVDKPEAASLTPVLKPDCFSNVKVSAKTGEGVDKLLSEIERCISSTRRLTKFILPYNEGQLINQVHNKCEIMEEEHKAEGAYIAAYLNEEMENKVRQYIIK